MAPCRSPRPVSTTSAHLLAILLPCVACGAGAPATAPQAPVSASSATSGAALAAAPPAPDLSPVADPAHLVLSGHLANPNASLAIIHGWSQLPLVQPDQVTELLAGEALGPLVDLDAPIDFAVSVQGQGMGLRFVVALSAGVKDAEAAKATLREKYSLVPGPNGVLLIQGLGSRATDDGTGDSPDDAGAERTCELAPAFGVPATRLVCADDPKALGELAQWLTRTAPRTASSSDLEVEARLAPLRQTFTAFRQMASMLVGGLLGGGLSQGTNAAAVAAATDLLDFAVDLEGATFDLDLADPLATARATLHFTGARSTLTRVMLAHPDGGAAAPASFWQLPADADFGLFERGIDAADLATTVRLAAQVADGVLSDAGLKDADRKAVLDALAKLPSSAPLAYGSGLDGDAVAAAVRATRDGAAGKDAARSVLQALLGWRVLVLDEPSARLAGAFKDVAAAMSRPGVAAVSARGKGGAPLAVHGLPLPKGIKLPAGSLHYGIDVPLPRDGAAATADARKGKSGPPLTLHLVLVPDGSRTWLGIAGDAALAASRVTASISAPGDPRADRGPLDHDKVGAAGFFDVRSLPEAVVQLSVLGGEPVPEALSLLDAVGTLPHRGLAPVVFSMTAQPGNTAVMDLQVPRATIEDAVVLGLSHAQP
jgi:hypothetical protein